MTETKGIGPRFCHACGAELPPGDAFCASCGTPARAVGPSAPVDGEPAAAAPSAAPTGVMTATVEPQHESAAGTPPARKSPVRLDVVLLVAGLAVAAVGGYLLTRSGGETVSTAVDAEEEAPPPLDYGDEDAGAATDAPAAATATPATGGATGTVTTCSNDAIGYSLSYPADWYTASNGPRQSCRYFHTEPFTVVDASEPDATLFVFPVNVSFEEWDESFEQDGVSTISRQDTTVDGRSAIQVEFGYTDEGEFLGYLYVVDHDGEVLVFGTESEHAADYEAAKDVVDGVAASLTFL